MLGVGAAAPSAQTAQRALPAPSFSIKGALDALTAAGPTLALALEEEPGCTVRVANLVRRTLPTKTGNLAPCRDDRSLDA